MSVDTGGNDNDIIKVDEQSLLVQPTESLLHESLKHGRSRCKSDRQPLPLPEPIRHHKRTLVLCIRTQENLPVPAQ